LIHRVATALLLVPMLLLSGCPKLGALDAFMPKVSFKRLDVKKIDFRHVETDFVFNVANPNPIRVKLASFAYDLQLGGASLIKGDEGEGFTLNASGDSRLNFPVNVVFMDLIKLVDGVAGADTVPFTFKGSFGFNTPLGQIKIPFREAGDFPVIQAPKVAIRGVSVGKLDLLRQSATISIDLGLTHKGGSAIDFSGFDYAIKLGGRKVAEGLIADLATVPPGTERAVAIPIQINLLEVGATIVEAITRKTKIGVELDATVGIATPFGLVPLSIDETGQIKVQ
jgi:LEA14-like dessication related protein